MDAKQDQLQISICHLYRQKIPLNYLLLFLFFVFCFVLTCGLEPCQTVAVSCQPPVLCGLQHKICWTAQALDSLVYSTQAHHHADLGSGLEIKTEQVHRSSLRFNILCDFMVHRRVNFVLQVYTQSTRLFTVCPCLTKSHLYMALTSFLFWNNVTSNFKVLNAVANSSKQMLEIKTTFQVNANGIQLRNEMVEMLEIKTTFQVYANGIRLRNEMVEMLEIKTTFQVKHCLTKTIL